MGPNPEAARRRFTISHLEADIQVLAANAAAYQVPSNRNGAAPPPQAPKLEDIKLIEYDFVGVRFFRETRQRSADSAGTTKWVRIAPN